MATKAAPPAEPSQAPATPPPLGDIRAGRPQVFGSSITALLRRTASIVSLVLLDLCGLVLGLYAALVLRALLYGEEVLWGAIWRVETNWLPFLGLVQVLVFWRAGLYAERERRGGGGRIVGSMILVGAVALAFGIGTNHEFGTYGLAPTAVVLSIVFIGLLRASYDVLTADLLRFAGIRRRAVLVGSSDRIEHLRGVLGKGRGGIAYDWAGARRRSWVRTGPSRGHSISPSACWSSSSACRSGSRSPSRSRSARAARSSSAIAESA